MGTFALAARIGTVVGVAAAAWVVMVAAGLPMWAGAILFVVMFTAVLYAVGWYLETET